MKERIIGISTIAIVIAVNSLIYLTGGVVNPFIIFLLIPSVFASSNLSLRTNLLLVITTTVSYTHLTLPTNREV